MKNYGNRMLAKGITVSNDTFETSMNNNDLVFGTSGCGKTGGYVVPMLQNPTESMVVVDAKNNLSRMFTKSLQEKGYRVQLLDFVRPKNSTCGYNPLAYIKPATGRGFSGKKLKALAHALVPEYDKDELIWDASARKYLSLLLCYVICRLPKKEQNMESIIKLHSAVCDDPKRMREVMQRDIDEQPVEELEQERMLDNLVKQVFGMSKADKMWSSVLEFASTALSPYDTGEMQYVLSRKKTLDISRLGREKTVLFLNISDMDRSCDNIVNLLYLQLFQELEAEAAKNPDGRLKMPVRILMDDFASGAKMDDFDKIISVIRSRDISVSLIIQSLSQLASLYGEGPAKTILNNCDHLLYMGGNDRETLDYVAHRVNKPVSIIAQKPREKIYLITAGEPAALVDKIPPYSTLEVVSGDDEAQM